MSVRVCVRVSVPTRRVECCAAAEHRPLDGWMDGWMGGRMDG